MGEEKEETVLQELVVVLFQLLYLHFHNFVSSYRRRHASKLMQTPGNSSQLFNHQANSNILIAP